MLLRFGVGRSELGMQCTQPAESICKNWSNRQWTEQWKIKYLQVKIKEFRFCEAPNLIVQSAVKFEFIQNWQGGKSLICYEWKTLQCVLLTCNCKSIQSTSSHMNIKYIGFVYIKDDGRKARISVFALYINQRFWRMNWISLCVTTFIKHVRCHIRF